jgi:hypothetical protein
MILKIIGEGIGGGLRWIECDRVSLGGYNGGSGQKSSRTIYLEWNDGSGSSVEIAEDEHGYLLNDAGKTVDKIYYNDR